MIVATNMMVQGENFEDLESNQMVDPPQYDEDIAAIDSIETIRDKRYSSGWKRGLFYGAYYGYGWPYYGYGFGR